MFPRLSEYPRRLLLALARRLTTGYCLLIAAFWLLPCVYGLLAAGAHPNEYTKAQDSLRANAVSNAAQRLSSLNLSKMHAKRSSLQSKALTGFNSRARENNFFDEFIF